MENFDLLSVIVIALGLSMDCFAVAISYSILLKKPTVLKAVRLPLAFGIAQAIMPVIGWLVGRTVIEFIEGFDHWVAFALLLAVGGHMLWESFRCDEDEEKSEGKDIARGFMLVTLSLATSIDALAVGLSFAFLKINIAMASLTIGVVCFLVTLAGFLAGRKVGRLFGERAEILGGVILIGIGIRILLNHLLE